MPSLPGAVASASATSATATSISMTWTPTDSNGTNFRIFRLPGGVDGNPIFVTQLPDNPSDPITTYTDAGLLPGETYAYEIECGNLAGYSAYAGFSTQTRTAPPTQLLAVPADSQVTLSWTAPAGAESFNIYRGSEPGGESPTPLATGFDNGTSYVDATAADGAEYYYEVTAVDSGGESARSAEASATPQVPTSAPLPPTGLTATTPSNGAVLLAWQPPPGASTYNIYRGTASNTEVLVQSGLSGPSYFDSGLTDGETYYYEVTGVNHLGEGTQSSEISAVPQVTVPPTPINVTATPGNNQVSLSWSAASDALTYNVYRSTLEGNEALYAQGITGTSYTDSNVTNGITYYYEVSAGNGVGASNLSQEVSATPLPPLPSAPAALTATALSSWQISLTWTEPAAPGNTGYPAASFTVEHAIDGGAFTPLTTLDGTATSFVDANGVDPNFTYSYELSATNLAGTSAWSNVSTTTPLMQVAAATGSPSLWADADIGEPTLAGSAYFDSVNDQLVVNGTGYDIWNTSVTYPNGSTATIYDQFHFVYVPFTGNGTIIAQVLSQGDTNAWAKAGVMFRSTLASDTPFVDMVMTPGEGASFQYRNSSGTLGDLPSSSNGYSVPEWVALVCSGTTITGYVSTNGSTWTEVSSYTRGL